MGRESGRAIRLLYVADEAGDGDDIRGALERQPEFDVAVATDAADGLGHVDERVDCVVCRHGSRIDGLSFLEAVRARQPDLPFVLVAPDDGRLAGEAVAADVSGYVPGSDEEAPSLLLERVRSVVDDVPRLRPDGAPPMPIERLGVREELRLKERAMEEAPVGITISDPDQPDNPLIYLNDAFVDLTGYAKEGTVGRNCRFLQGEESDPEAVAALRRAIDDEEPVSVELVNYRKDGERFWNQVDVAPVRDERGEVTNFVGFQTDVTARKEAEFEVKRERRHLEHVLNRVNGLVQDVTGDLVRAVSREGVERSVCERIAATDAYAFCWIGEPDLASDTLGANARAGAWDPDAAALEVDLVDPTVAAAPVAAAYETERLQVVDDPDELAAIVEASPWIDGELEGIAAIPLVYRETSYGVLTVYTTREGALNDREAVVLEAIGRATATAINALERERIIAADNVIELEFAIRDRDLFFVDLSARHDADVEYNGSIHRDDGSMLMFFTADVDPSAVEDAVSDHPEVEEAALVNEGDDGHLYEFTVGTDSIITTLAERGARTRSMDAVDGAGRVVVELPTETDARAIVELLQERYPGTELVAYREREHPPETKQEFIAELKAALTERQLTALQTAYVSGFYEWNRRVSGDELAASMDIARSTFHQHLRAAERKLIGQIFEAD